MSFLEAMKRGLRSVIPEQRYTVLLVPQSYGAEVQRFAFRLSTAVGAFRLLIAASVTLLVVLSALTLVLMLSDSPSRLRAEQTQLLGELHTLRQAADEAGGVRDGLRAEVARVHRMVRQEDQQAGIGPLSELDLRAALAPSLPTSLPEGPVGRRESSGTRSLADRPFDVVVESDGPYRLRNERRPGAFADAGAARAVALASPRGKPIDAWVVSAYGFRRSPWNAQREFHAGVDLVAPHGTPVRSTGPGVVVFAGSSPDAHELGLTVAVDHGHGVVTRYGHLSRIKVAVGQQVLRSAVLGEVGSTGNSSGPHLHYEMLQEGMPVDPEPSFEDFGIGPGG
jgi:murein DD-endopeptidase MepM/ murein hydrolase activator NlpD